MQLLPQQFYDLTWGEYNCRVRGWLRQEEERWDHTRHLYYLLYNEGLKPKDQVSMKDLIPLRKDRRNMLLQAPAATESVEDMVARIKKRDNIT